MHARTQITIDAATQRKAQAKAAELGISFAEYVRRLVSADLGQRAPKADVSILFDLGASGGVTDVARDKDSLLGQAVWDEHLRKTRGESRAARRRTR